MLVNAACSTLTLHLVSQLPGEKELCSTMVRYVNLVMHLSYMALNGALDDADFQLLRKRKLLLGRDEEDKLRAHERGACTVAQVPYTWVMRMVATLRRDGRFTENEAMRFEQELTLLRSRASRQNTYQVERAQISGGPALYLFGARRPSEVRSAVDVGAKRGKHTHTQSQTTHTMSWQDCRRNASQVDVDLTLSGGPTWGVGLSRGCPS